MCGNVNRHSVLQNIREIISKVIKSSSRVRRGASSLGKQLTSLRYTPGRFSVHTLHCRTGALRRLTELYLLWTPLDLTYYSVIANLVNSRCGVEDEFINFLKKMRFIPKQNSHKTPSDNPCYIVVCNNLSAGVRLIVFYNTSFRYYIFHN